MRRAELLIHIAGWLVPAGRRKEWLREWLAELGFLDSRGVGHKRLTEFARGAFWDAWWQRQNGWDREAAAAQLRSAQFCLAALGAAISLIAAFSGSLPIARSVFLPLPYREPQQIAIASQLAGGIAAQRPLRAESVALWNTRGKLLEGSAAYIWQSRTVARVSDNFFALLGARFEGGGAACSDCVVLSYREWQRSLKGRPVTPQSTITLDGRHYRVAGVLDKRFWFLSRDIRIWKIAPLASFQGERTGVVTRLAHGVSWYDAGREMTSILQEATGGNPWNSLVRLTPLEERVHSVFGSFGLALGLALVVVAAGSRLWRPSWSLRGALFFLGKTGLALSAVFLAGLEFTHVASMTMLGGGDALSELLSTWLLLLGCMGVLAWSVRDQQARCRVCLRRLAMPMRVGCPGCLLLDWAGTELVCMEGHGMLHIPELAACWEEPERWTSLDDSWQELFHRS